MEHAPLRTGYPVGMKTQWYAYRQFYGGYRRLVYLLCIQNYHLAVATIQPVYIGN